MNRYRVEVLEDGEIHLIPVVSLTRRELVVLKRPDIMAALKSGVEEAERGGGVRYEHGYFAQTLAEQGIDPYAPDDDELESVAVASAIGADTRI